MSFPVKISDELYNLVKQRAEEKGITFQQALQELMDESKLQLKRLEEKLSHKEQELKRKEAELASLKHSKDVSDKDRETYKAELTRKEKEIHQLNEEISSYRSEITDASQEIDSLEEQLEEEKAAKEQYKQQLGLHKRLLWIAAIILGIVVALMVLRWSQGRQEEAPAQAQPPQLTEEEMRKKIEEYDEKMIEECNKMFGIG